MSPVGPPATDPWGRQGKSPRAVRGPKPSRIAECPKSRQGNGHAVPISDRRLGPPGPTHRPKPLLESH
jgi:predicted secreted protein